MMSLAILSRSLGIVVSKFVLGMWTTRGKSLPEIVRDDNDTTGEVVDGVSERVNGRDIETVGRLVEQEHVGSVNGKESEDDSALLALGKGAHKGGL
jgi:hypothetical protein